MMAADNDDDEEDVVDRVMMIMMMMMIIIIIISKVGWVWSSRIGLLLLTVTDVSTTYFWNDSWVPTFHIFIIVTMKGSP